MSDHQSTSIQRHDAESTLIQLRLDSTPCVHFVTSLKETASQTDQHFVSLSSKIYVFEDKMTSTSQPGQPALSVNK